MTCWELLRAGLHIVICMTQKHESTLSVASVHQVNSTVTISAYKNPPACSANKDRTIPAPLLVFVALRKIPLKVTFICQPEKIIGQVWFLIVAFDIYEVYMLFFISGCNVSKHEVNIRASTVFLCFLWQLPYKIPLFVKKQMQQLSFQKAEVWTGRHSLHPKIQFNTSYPHLLMGEY